MAAGSFRHVAGSNGARATAPSSIASTTCAKGNEKKKKELTSQRGAVTQPRLPCPALSLSGDRCPLRPPKAPVKSTKPRFSPFRSSFPNRSGLWLVPREGSMARSLDGCYSAKDVAYSCGYCGYALNLSSSTRNTANIGSKYGKQIRKGVISFFAIDESRFTQTDEVSCTPYFRSGFSWGLFRNRTRLLCRKCSGHIGNAYEDEDSTLYDSLDDAQTSSEGSSMSSRKKYVIKINALQPSSEDSGVPFTL